MPGEQPTSHAPQSGSDQPPHRYAGALAAQIEAKWQDFWQEHGTFRAPNPGEPGFDGFRPKRYVLDMFPYPSGVGLHVGHPLGYIATDIFARYQRMTGHNVLHAMGYDAFGLPAEQYAVQTGTHPRITTERNIATMRAQLRRLGLAHDERRSIATTDPGFYKWTQWIFLRLYHSWYDPRAGGARPIAELERALDSGEAAPGCGRAWAELSADERRAEIDSRRLAYLGEVPVNWCPQLGTVLANEEVTADGRSERGNFPVFRRPLRQWMLRITAYAERLLNDLDALDWPEPIKQMQRNWIGRSEGAFIDFAVLGGPLAPRADGAKSGAEAAADLRDVAACFERDGLRALRPSGFIGRDPYPPGVYGPISDLVANRGNLPHLSLPGATYFATWKTIEGMTLSPTEQDLVLSSLLHFDGRRCRVYAATVMNNHLHWIVRPFDGDTLDALIRSVKHFSAVEINKQRGASGHLWDSERFDHIIRDRGYFNEFTKYVIDNPVEAGIVARAADYRWTFVHHDALGGPRAPRAGSFLGSPQVGGTSRSRSERATQEAIRVFTTRPDTLFGATYVVLSPEHPLVDQIAAGDWADAPAPWRGVFPGSAPEGYPSPRDAVAAYRRYARGKSDVQRSEAKVKTGVFTGAYATNPATDRPVPVFIADYVLTGYGTGAIMAVPGQDQRDWDFARVFDLQIVRTVHPPDGFDGEAFTGDGPAMNSGFLDGLEVGEAKHKMTAWLEEQRVGRGAVTYKLRDWLFSRQRYWGEPFPIVYGEQGRHHALPESMLPVLLPDLADFHPEASDDPDAPPRPPLARAREWVHVTLDLGEGPKRYTRETNTMPNWAGSCWYYLRYLDPENDKQFCAPEVERYWMAGISSDSPHSALSPGAPGHSALPFGGVDLYVGGVEHAVLHLLYARFWHKVLFDLGHVSTPEPFGKLFNQGYIQAAAYADERGIYVEASEVEEREGKFFHGGNAVAREFGKMGKSLRNAVAPDEICAEYGCDTMRVYEMSMGPLEASKPWNTRDIVGSYRFLQRVWRNLIDEQTGALRTTDQPADAATLRLLHKTIKGVRRDMDQLGFNTVVAKLIELNNHLGTLPAVPREAATPLVLMLAPLAPHIAEELWHRLRPAQDAARSLAFERYPIADDRLAADDVIEIPVQIAGKVRARITVPAGADAKATEAAAMTDPRVIEHIGGKPVRKVIVVPGRMVNIVL